MIQVAVTLSIQIHLPQRVWVGSCIFTSRARSTSPAAWSSWWQDWWCWCGGVGRGVEGGGGREVGDGAMWHSATRGTWSWLWGLPWALLSAEYSFLKVIKRQRTNFKPKVSNHFTFLIFYLLPFVQMPWHEMISLRSTFSINTFKGAVVVNNLSTCE